MELSNLPFEELIELRNRIDGMIRSYKDGYLYIMRENHLMNGITETVLWVVVPLVVIIMSVKLLILFYV